MRANYKIENYKFKKINNAPETYLIKNKVFNDMYILSINRGDIMVEQLKFNYRGWNLSTMYTCTLFNEDRNYFKNKVERYLCSNNVVQILKELKKVELNI